MIELAVGVARYGREKLREALADLSGELESQLAALLETGLRLVGDEGRRVLDLLRLFPTGRCMPEALDAVGAALEGSPDTQTAGEVGQSPPWVAEGLRQLEQVAIVEFEPQSRLYHFHQSVLDYLHRRPLPSEESRVRGTLALLGYYAGYLRANRKNFEAIDRCFENVMLLMESLWAQREEAGPLDGILAMMVDALGYYFDARGHWQLGQRWHERAIELRRTSAHATDDAALAHELYRQAILHQNRGEPDLAREKLAQAMAAFENADDKQGLAAALHELGRLESAQGNPGEARRLLARSIQILEGLGDQGGLAASLHQLAIVESDQGNPGEARRLLSRSIQIDEALGNQGGVAASLHQLAIVESTQGNLGEARRLLSRSIQIKEALGDQRGLAASLHQLAIVESDQGNPGEARRLLSRSSQILEALGDQAGLAGSLHQLAIVESHQGNPGEARRLLSRSIQIGEALGNQLGLAASLHVLAIVECAQGNPGEARRLLSRSIQIKEALGNQLGLAASLRQLAILECDQGNPGEARRLLSRSIQITEALGDTAGKAVSMGMLAQLEAMAGRFGEAIAMARQAVRDLESLGYAQAEQARGVLKGIEAYIAQAKDGASGNAAPWLRRLQQAIARAETEGPGALDAPTPSADPAEEVIRHLARSVILWRQGQSEACDAAVQQAGDVAARAEEPGRTELLALVAQLQSQRVNAGAGRPAESVRLHAEGMARVQEKAPNEALKLFEASLAASHVEQNVHNAAMNLLAIGQVLMLLDHRDEAAERLREGLEIAGTLGDEELLKAFRTLLTVARQSPPGAGPDD
jgi:tetratricopeptide (TPR) repeat protein